MTKHFLASCLIIAMLLCNVGCGKLIDNSDVKSEDVASVNSNSNSSDSKGGKKDIIKESKNDYKFYFYQTGFTQPDLVLDQNGNELSDKRQFNVLCDIVTGKPQCQTSHRLTDTEKKNEYGYPIAKYETAIFDMDGKMLLDYSEKVFSEAFGDFVISSNRGNGIEVDDAIDYDEKLINMRTGETVLDGVGNLAVLDAEKGTFVANSLARRAMLGVIDKDGKIITPISERGKYSCSEAFDNKIIACEIYETGQEIGTPKHFLMSDKFEKIMSVDYISSGFGSFRGDYFFVRNGYESAILDYSLKEVFKCDASYNISYYDGNIAIVSQRLGDTWKVAITDTNGKAIVKDYDSIMPIEEKSDSKLPAEKFIGVKEDCIYIIDNNGKIIASKKESNITLCEYIGDGLIAYRIEDGFNVSNAVLLDMNLNAVKLKKEYNSMRRRYDSFSGRFERNDELLICNYNLSNNNNIERCDIYDRDFNLIIEGVESVYGATSDRIAVEKGFSRGIIDYKGNWVKKYSIFDSFRVEDGEGSVYW